MIIHARTHITGMFPEQDELHLPDIFPPKRRKISRKVSSESRTSEEQTKSISKQDGHRPKQTFAYNTASIERCHSKYIINGRRRYETDEVEKDTSKILQINLETDKMKQNTKTLSSPTQQTNIIIIHGVKCAHTSKVCCLASEIARTNLSHEFDPVYSIDNTAISQECQGEDKVTNDGIMANDAKDNTGLCNLNNDAAKVRDGRDAYSMSDMHSIDIFGRHSPNNEQVEIKTMLQLPIVTKITDKINLDECNVKISNANSCNYSNTKCNDVDHGPVSRNEETPPAEQRPTHKSSSNRLQGRHHFNFYIDPLLTKPAHSRKYKLPCKISVKQKGTPNDNLMNKVQETEKNEENIPLLKMEIENDGWSSTLDCKYLPTESISTVSNNNSAKDMKTATKQHFYSCILNKLINDTHQTPVRPRKQKYVNSANQNSGNTANHNFQKEDDKNFTDNLDNSTKGGNTIVNKNMPPAKNHVSTQMKKDMSNNNIEMHNDSNSHDHDNRKKPNDIFLGLSCQVASTNGQGYCDSLGLKTPNHESDVQPSDPSLNNTVTQMASVAYQIPLQVTNSVVDGDAEKTYSAQHHGHQNNNLHNMIDKNDETDKPVGFKVTNHGVTTQSKSLCSNREGTNSPGVFYTDDGKINNYHSMKDKQQGNYIPGDSPSNFPGTQDSSNVLKIHKQVLEKVKITTHMQDVCSNEGFITGDQGRRQTHCTEGKCSKHLQTTPNVSRSRYRPVNNLSCNTTKTNEHETQRCNIQKHIQCNEIIQDNCIMLSEESQNQSFNSEVQFSSDIDYSNLFDDKVKEENRQTRHYSAEYLLEQTRDIIKASLISAEVIPIGELKNLDETSKNPNEQESSSKIGTKCETRSNNIAAIEMRSKESRSASPQTACTVVNYPENRIQLNETVQTGQVDNASQNRRQGVEVYPKMICDTKHSGHSCVIFQQNSDTGKAYANYNINEPMKPFNYAGNKTTGTALKAATCNQLNYVCYEGNNQLYAQYDVSEDDINRTCGTDRCLPTKESSLIGFEINKKRGCLNYINDKNIANQMTRAINKNIPKNNKYANYSNNSLKIHGWYSSRRPVDEVNYAKENGVVSSPQTCENMNAYIEGHHEVKLKDPFRERGISKIKNHCEIAFPKDHLPINQVDESSKSHNARHEITRPFPMYYSGITHLEGKCDRNKISNQGICPTHTEYHFHRNPTVPVGDNKHLTNEVSSSLRFDNQFHKPIYFQHENIGQFVQPEVQHQPKKGSVAELQHFVSQSHYPPHSTQTVPYGYQYGLMWDQYYRETLHKQQWLDNDKTLRHTPNHPYRIDNRRELYAPYQNNLKL